ncbi:MAG: family 43 glycosylhydrolase [Hymenobacter sp.]
MFYAANGCCGPGCTYATGVARAKKLLGPWEKYDRNPILTKNDAWTCPGHGTPIERAGRWYMLHHAYQTAGFQNSWPPGRAQRVYVDQRPAGPSF